MINISQKYEPYRRFKSFYEEGGELEAYIFMLLNDNSHITIKLIQAINFLNNKLYFKRATSFALTVSYLSRVLVERANNMEMELIEILPPSFFNIDIEFTKGDRFNTMSSGEKQRVYSIATVLYHLNNVSSTSRKIQLYKYERVNIIFDELELYFHPDLQRTLVNDLLQNIKKIDLKDVNAINMLFITHSPFILSDVQRNNILVLEKDGTPRRGGLNMQTFGANIFDLLKDSFFLKNGPMGELAKCKINETIDWLQKKDPDLQEASFHKSVIDLIGEPILQMTLLEMFDKLTGSRTKADMIREKISELERQLENENN